MSSRQRIACTLCNSGNIVRRKVYRLSGPVIVIGYLLVIPSILGIVSGGACVALSTGGCVATGAATMTALAEAQGKPERELARQSLTDAGVPTSIVEQVLNGEPLSPEQTASLDALARTRVAQVGPRLATTDRNEYLEDLQAAEDLGTAGAAAASTIASGFGLFVMAASLIAGLLGYLLIMKKSVLQCTTCKATLSAS